MILSDIRLLATLKARVTPSSEDGVLDSYDVGHTTLPETPTDAEQLVVRDIAVAASNNVILSLDDFTIPADAGVEYRDADGDVVNIADVYALLIYLVSADTEGQTPVVDLSVADLPSGTAGNLYLDGVGSVTLLSFANAQTLSSTKELDIEEVGGNTGCVVRVVVLGKS